MQVRDVIRQQRHPVDVHTVAQERTVEEAIAWMTAQQIPALIVTAGEVPVGIFTPRDVLRCHTVWRHRPFSELPLKTAITGKLMVAHPDDRVSDITAMMIQGDIGHLPVVENQRVVGLLTFAQLVRHYLEQLTADLNHLQDYITHLQDAGQD